MVVAGKGFPDFRGFPGTCGIESGEGVCGARGSPGEGFARFRVCGFDCMLVWVCKIQDFPDFRAVWPERMLKGGW